MGIGFLSSCSGGGFARASRLSAHSLYAVVTKNQFRYDKKLTNIDKYYSITYNYD